jgi:hypothetical protein
MTVAGHLVDVPLDHGNVLEPEFLVLVGAAEGALVMGAPHRHLYDHAVGLAGGPYHVSDIVHINTPLYIFIRLFNNLAEVMM